MEDKFEEIQNKKDFYSTFLDNILKIETISNNIKTQNKTIFDYKLFLELTVLLSTTQQEITYYCSGLISNKEDSLYKLISNNILSFSYTTDIDRIIPYLLNNRKDSPIKYNTNNLCLIKYIKTIFLFLLDAEIYRNNNIIRENAEKIDLLNKDTELLKSNLIKLRGSIKKIKTKSLEVNDQILILLKNYKKELIKEKNNNENSIELLVKENDELIKENLFLNDEITKSTFIDNCYHYFLN